MTRPNSAPPNDGWRQRDGLMHRREHHQLNNVIDCSVCGELTRRPASAGPWAMIRCPDCVQNHEEVPMLMPQRQNASIDVDETENNPTDFTQVPMTQHWLDESW